MANRHKKMLNITHHQGNARLNPMRCHVALVRPSKIQETKNYRCWQGCGDNGMLVGQRLQVDAATTESRREVSQRTAVLSVMLWDEEGQ